MCIYTEIEIEIRIMVLRRYLKNRFAQVLSEIGYLICLRHFIRLTAVANLKSIFKKVRQKLICVSAKYVIKILPLMNHQPFFALLKVKLNSVCHKKIIDCLQKNNERKKNLSVNKGKTTKIKK